MATPNFRTYDIASEDHEGQLSITTNAEGHGGRSNVCICIKNYNDYTWTPVGEISAVKWMRYRETISEEVLEKLQGTAVGMKELETLREEAAHFQDASRMIRDLYDGMNREERQMFIRKYEDTFLGRHTCEKCLNYTARKVKCLHSDCSGMCEDCARGIREICPVCNKRQEITCPICQENKVQGQLVRSDSCEHAVCWICYGTAYKHGAPIDKCPLCRGVFTRSAPPPAHPDDAEIAQQLHDLLNGPIAIATPVVRQAEEIMQEDDPAAVRAAAASPDVGEPDGGRAVTHRRPGDPISRARGAELTAILEAVVHGR